MATSPQSSDDETPDFDARFREDLVRLFRWRRDVRHFRRDALSPGLLDELLDLANLAPSVGLSEPWRFVEVAGVAARQAVLENFRRCNADALASYQGEDAQRYAGLKLAGLQEAPVHLAVFSDESTPQGKGLGRRTMPETLRYSVVGAIQILWLAARSHGVGLGWVSILDPEALKRDLSLPADWVLVAYLCLGYPAEDHLEPELQRRNWEQRGAPADRRLQR